jgi:succinate-semialdehyde dehydrogenase/glutarate-semialdehyde dehydrogenase
MRLTERVKKINVGYGLENGVDIGPLISISAMEKVQNHVDDAMQQGAKVQLGGSSLQSKFGGYFFEPTVISNGTPKMAFSQEETFGPLAAVVRFETEAEAIHLANNTTMGLAAYFFSRDVGQVLRVSDALEYGMVGVNEGMLSAETAPFGGRKESGFGREGSKYGLDDCEYFISVSLVN